MLERQNTLPDGEDSTANKRDESRYKVDICRISECRWTKSGKINLTTGETMVYSVDDENHKRGVAIVIPKEMAKCF